MQNLNYEDLIKNNPKVDPSVLKELFSVLKELEEYDSENKQVNIIDPFGHKISKHQDDEASKKIRYGMR